jgi:hypothetical protein
VSDTLVDEKADDTCVGRANQCVKTARMESLKFKLGYDCVFVVDCVGRSGGLALFWKEDFQVTIQNYSLRHINRVIFSEVFDCSWKFTGFYGHPEVHKRKESWNLLRHLAKLSPLSWLCMGDFNEIIDDAEKWGGRVALELK